MAIEINIAKLKLYFDRGEIGLYWKDLKLTKNIGLHSVFRLGDRLYISSDAQWQFTKISPEKLHISINHIDIPIIQNWLLNLTHSSELSWEVSIQVKQPLHIHHKKLGLFLSDNYTRWFYFSDQGEFPPGFRWDDTLLKKHIFLDRLDNYSFGVKPSGRYPGILFEVNAEGSPLLQNTNKEISGRAVQFELKDTNQDGYYEPGNYKWCSSKIKIIENETAVCAYIEDSREKLLTAKSFGNDNLKLCFDDRKAKLYWNDLELTKHFCLNTIFYLNDTWYGSSYNDWEFKRIGKDKLRIDINYRDIPVVHIWLLKLTGPNEFSWEVEMQVAQPLHIQQKKFGLFVTDKYTRWFNSGEEGEFSSVFNWQNILLNRIDSRGFGVKPSGRYPGILFEVNAEGIPLLQNTNEEFSARVVQFELEDIDKDDYYESGIYKWCSSKIKIIEDERIIDEYIDKSRRKLLTSKSFREDYIENPRENLLAVKSFGNDKLKLFFDECKVRLFWNKLEITKNLGLHAALSVEDKWYDTSRAMWQFKESSTEKMYIKVKYRDIPIIHTWIFILIGPNELSWEIEMEVKQRLHIQHNKITLFVSDKYTQWFNSCEDGEFPRGFNWQNIILNQIDSRGFGVKPNGEYPGILFEVDAEGIPVIQNTNEQLKSRAVQFELSDGKDKMQYAPGNTYKLFSGKIKLIENEKIINDYIARRQLLPLEPLDNETIYIFGDSEDLHNKIAASPTDFKEKLQRIKQGLDKNKRLNIKIGVSRFNFFRIKEIAEYAFSLLGKNIDLVPICLDLFPVQKLYFNFVNYIEEIKAKIKDIEVKLVLVDEELFEILLTVASQVNLYNEKKLIRLLSVIVEHTFLGPQIVVIDPYHRCNVNCLHCWVHTPKIKHTDEFLGRKLDFDTYKHMIDDFTELKVDSIIFQGDGEPLLHDKFFEMVRYARGKGIEVLFFTNGLLLDKDIAQESVALGVNQIFCSLPAGTDKTYCLITHRQDLTAFRKVLDNLKYLTLVKRQANKIYPKLIMTHVIHTLNYKEIMEMAENDVEVGADVMRFYLIRLDDNIKFLQLKPEEIEPIRESMSKVKAYLKDKHVELLDTTDFQLNHYEKDTGAWSKGVFLREGCPLGWFFCLVPALGDLSLCCHLRTVGYLKEKSFKEIWTSKEYERYRVQAKYLKDNKDVTFLNGVKLYDEHCEHCDTHQVIRDIREELKNYNLERFVFK